MYKECHLKYSDYEIRVISNTTERKTNPAGLASCGADDLRVWLRGKGYACPCPDVTVRNEGANIRWLQSPQASLGL